MSDAIKITVTEDELRHRAKQYLTNLYGPVAESSDKDKWNERFGLLCGFVDTVFQEGIGIL